MNSTPSSQPLVENSVPSGVLPSAVHPSDTGFHRASSSSAENISASAKLGPRRIGYGLPCVKCKTYYAADLSACPVCKTKERVLPMPLVTANSGGRLAEPVGPGPDDIALEEERERFLREFKARVYESDSQMDDDLDTHIGLHAPGCSLEASHQGGVEPATVCQGCYARLQEKVDLLEAALHIDLKDATQLIYDAVWSEPSDPSKTYHNAARAILGELRKRAGISVVLGPLKPLAH
jgi:hypothetical protein